MNYFVDADILYYDKNYDNNKEESKMKDFMEEVESFKYSPVAFANLLIYIKTVINLAKEMGIENDVLLNLVAAQIIVKDMDLDKDPNPILTEEDKKAIDKYKDIVIPRLKSIEEVKEEIADKPVVRSVEITEVEKVRTIDELREGIKEPVDIEVEKVNKKVSPSTVKAAHTIAEKNGKGFSYFGKFFTDKRSFQKKLHLTGDIKRYVDQEMEKGRSLEESVEEWCHNNIFDIMTVTFNKKTYNMSNYIKRAGIAAGYVRAEKLESPSISWEKALKRIISKMKLEAPKQEELEDIVTPYQFMITPVSEKKNETKTTRKIPVDYKGVHYDTKIDFYIANHIYGQYQKEVRSYETSGLFKDTGDMHLITSCLLDSQMLRI